MTHVDDLHEPNDRGPGEPEQEPPLDLDEVEAAHEQALIELGESWAVGEENTELVLRHLLPKALAELRQARERTAEFEALPTREEWAVTENEATPPKAETIGYFTAEGAMRSAEKHGVQAWRRVRTADPVVVRDWEPISPEAPF